MGEMVGLPHATQPDLQPDAPKGMELVISKRYGRQGRGAILEGGIRIAHDSYYIHISKGYGRQGRDGTM